MQLKICSVTLIHLSVLQSGLHRALQQLLLASHPNAMYLRKAA